MTSERVLGVRIDATSYSDATARIVAWAKAGESRVVCAANVHMVMEAFDTPDFRAVLENADLVTPDGMPLVWYLRAMGRPQARVYGPDLMLKVCEAAAREGLPVGLFGATTATLDALARRLTARFSGLRIAWRHAPPFGEWGAAEDARIASAAQASGVRILFVGLGCPKQERWMGAQAGRLPAVMLGVGAAFDLHAGRVRQAPPWMQRRGLEWLFRLSIEPRRLAQRYARTNPRFIMLAGREIAMRIAGRAPHRPS